MRAYCIPYIDLLESLYKHWTVRMAPNDKQCAMITFDTGVTQGSALSPLLFLIFMNVLLCLVTGRGKRFNISHDRSCEEHSHKQVVNRATEQEEPVVQFNLIGFVDYLSLLAQSLGGSEVILNAIQEFELWC
jgi:hypothetical protein